MKSRIEKLRSTENKICIVLLLQLFCFKRHNKLLDNFNNFLPTRQ